MCVQRDPHRHSYSHSRRDSGEILLPRKPHTKHKLDWHRHLSLPKSGWGELWGQKETFLKEMTEKLCLRHPHIALSLFSQEEDLSLWALGESWHLKAHSHIHSLYLIGKLSRTSPSASLPSSKTLPYLWSRFSEGSERLVTLRAAPPLHALHQSRDSHALRRSFQAAHLSTWAPAERGLVQWGAAGTDLVLFPG